MDGRIDNITHGAAAVITLALNELRIHNEIRPRTIALLAQARDSLKSLCPECKTELDDSDELSRH